MYNSRALHARLQKGLAMGAHVLLRRQVLSLDHLFDELDILIIDLWSPVHRHHGLIRSSDRILSLRGVAWILGLSGLELPG